MRFTSCDLPAIGGERLLGWGRLWGTEAGDLLKGSAAAVPRQALSDGGENPVIFLQRQRSWKQCF